MRRLVLQMQTTLDGFMSAGPEEPAWQVWDWTGRSAWDAELLADFNGSLASADTILLSRPLVDGGYLDHWAGVGRAYPDDPDYAFARRVGDIEKVVVSRSAPLRQWPKTRVVTGALADAVTDLKAGPGADIIAFGGVRFAASLAAEGLVDEYQFHVNPTATGTGESVLPPGLKLEIADATAYSCGVVVLRYRPTRSPRRPNPVGQLHHAENTPDVS